MNVEEPTGSSRRDFLSGQAIRAQAERAGNALADRLAEATKHRSEPQAGPTVRLESTAMACEFSVIMNPGPSENVMLASDALDVVHALEAQLSVYRDDSELSQLNRRAGDGPVEVEPGLFDVLAHSVELATRTEDCFDPTSGAQIALWRRCRQENRIPSDDEIAAAVADSGVSHVTFDSQCRAVAVDRLGVCFDLAAIGKGYALDKASEVLEERNLQDWLFHGGRSSILARGDHQGLGGWPVGIMSPLFPKQRFATILLKDRAMSTSGSSIQYFRHEGRRYGHILDPRTGRPAADALSVTVVAPTAAEADALSTAFYVMGVEKAAAYCDNYPGVGALLFRPPTHGRRLEPIVCGIPDDVLYFTNEQPG